MKYFKIYIIGASGSGKSTLANKLQRLLDIKYYDLDNIFWYKKYTACKIKKERDSLLNKVLNKKKWIIEGVYTTWTEDAIKKSDLVIWLLPNTPILIFRLIKRYIFSKLKLNKKKISFKDTLRFIRNSIEYKDEKNRNVCDGYCEHKMFIKRNAKRYVIIRSNKDKKNLIKNLLNSKI